MDVLHTSNTYSTALAANYTLVLAFGQNNCGIAVHNSDGVLQLLGEYEFAMDIKENESVFFDFVRTQEVTRQTYKNIYIVVSGTKCTLVPGELYNDLYIDSYFRHTHKMENGEVLKPAYLFNDTTVLVYNAPVHQFYPARSKFFEATIEPRAAHYIRKSAKYHPARMNIFLEDERLYMVYCKNTEPVFFNSYPYNSVEEAAYFILNYYQVFNIAFQSLPLLLHTQEHPQLAEILANYAGACEVARLPKNQPQLQNFGFPFLIDFCS